MKKTLAILIAVLLVVSMFSVLVACDNGPTEYTITFREPNGKQIAQKETVSGKVTQADPTREGYIFGGWYVAASDTELYGEKVDIATYVFTKDTELYAKWDRKITPGEAEGYVLVGAGVEYGEWNTETAVKGEKAKKLVQDTTEVNKYSITWDVAALDQFKVITALGTVGSWDNGEINLGFEGVGSIDKKDAVKQDPAVLLVDAGGNIQALCAMNLTLTLVYAGAADSKIELTINSIPEGARVPSPIEEVGYGIMGNFSEGGYAETEGGDEELTVSSLTSELKLIPNATGTQWRYDGLELKANDEFIIRVNEDIVGLASYNKSALHRIDLDGATLPEGVAKEELFFSGKENIAARCDMTIDVILYTNSNQIAIRVKEVGITSKGDLISESLDIELFGKFADHNWDTGVEFTSTSISTATLESITLEAGDEVKIRSTGTWSGPINSDGWCIDEVTLADGVTAPEGVEDLKAYFFAGTNFGGGGNIVIAHGFTAKLDYNAKTYKMNVTILAIAEENA